MFALDEGLSWGLSWGWDLLLQMCTGDNGTIDGQGAIWWDSFHNHTLNFTRPHLVELRSSTDIVKSYPLWVNWMWLNWVLVIDARNLSYPGRTFMKIHVQIWVRNHVWVSPYYGMLEHWINYHRIVKPIQPFEFLNNAIIERLCITDGRPSLRSALKAERRRNPHLKGGVVVL